MCPLRGGNAANGITNDRVAARLFTLCPDRRTTGSCPLSDNTRKTWLSYKWIFAPATLHARHLGHPVRCGELPHRVDQNRRPVKQHKLLAAGAGFFRRALSRAGPQTRRGQNGPTIQLLCGED